MISFIVPAHNEEFELPRSLGALRTAADEAGEPYELIVVNDSSTDRTPEIAREFGAEVVNVNARQIAAARNAGARLARGEYFFFVDADTRITAQHVRHGLAALRSGCSGGSARMKMDGQTTLAAQAFLILFSAVYFTLRLGAGAFLFTTRQNFFAAGGFDEQYFAGEETYLSMALKKFGPFRVLREPVETSGRKVRMHGTGSVVRQFLAVIARGPRGLRSRERLPLWYDGKREEPSV